MQAAAFGLGSVRRLEKWGAMASWAHRRHSVWFHRYRVGLALGAAVAVGSVVAAPMGTAASATTPVSATTSYYEFNTDPATLAAQGQAGAGGAQGLVILDFGRPAFDGSSYGTFDFGDQFVSFAAISQAVESYIQAYSTLAPRGAVLTLAVGVNNSCGTGQPCGSAICGCRVEPPDFTAWGAHLAATVEQLRSWAGSVKARSPRSAVVKVVAGDDAEPSNDPAYNNTASVLRGYAQAVGGFQPSMVDYGSAEPGYWTPEQLYQVAYGYRPNVPVPEIYFPADAADWAGLVAYAKAKHGVALKFFGVLTDSPIGDTPGDAYNQLVGAIRPLTGQTSIPWSTNIQPLHP